MRLLSRRELARLPMIRATIAATVPVVASSRKVPGWLPITAGARCEITAAAADDQAGDKKLRSFSGVAYTGGPMNVEGWSYPVVVDLAGMKVPRQDLPALRQHDHNRIVGHTTAITVGDRDLKIKGQISGVGDDAKEVVDMADNGFPWQLSIGASPRAVAFLDRGEKTQVNGRTVTGPAYIARQSELGENSFVPLGADSKTSAKVAANAPGSVSSLEVLSMKFEQWIAAAGLKMADLSEDQITALRAAHAAQKPADPATDPNPAPPVKAAATDDPLVARRQLEAQETERVAGIRKICAAANSPKMKVERDGKTVEVLIEAEAIRENWDADKVELAVLRCSRPTGPAIHVAGGSGEQAPKVIECALALRAGISSKVVEKAYKPETIEAAEGRGMKGFGIVSLMCAMMQAAGEYFRPGMVDNDFIRAAFMADQRIRADGNFSTVSLSGILSNIANKALLDSYGAVNALTMKIAAPRDVNDFKQFSTYRLTDLGEFEEVGPTGELESAELGEESYSNQLATRGQIFTLTRQMITNDDLGAFLQIPRLIGRKAALAMEKQTFTKLLGNANNFFGEANNNLLTGGGSALSFDGLAAAATAFENQVDKAGDPVLVSPAILLCAPANRTLADQLYTSDQLAAVTANSKLPTRNIFAGRYRPESSPYLSNAKIAGHSSAAWYLLADPADVPTLEVAFLKGQRLPTIETGETNFNVLGMSWRGFFDFGVALADFRGAIKSAGA